MMSAPDGAAMRAESSTPRRRGRIAALALTTACAMSFGTLAAVPAFAAVDGSGVVINEAYLSGGSAGAAFTNKFVELYNPTGADDSETDPEPVEPEPVEAKTIAEVQGTGDASPLLGQTVTVEGVVIGDYRVGGYKGISIQTAGSGGADAPREASDGIFVYLNALAPELSIGDLVSVTGVVGENYGQTQISPSVIDDIHVVTADAGLPEVTPLAGTVVGADREAHENMLVAPAGDYRVASSHQLYNYGTLWLNPGELNIKSTEIYRPGDEANAVAQQNRAERILLDDGYNIQISNAAHTGEQPYFTKDVTVRNGDIVEFAEAGYVLQYGFDDWRLQPVTPIDDATPADEKATFQSDNARTETAPEVGGDVSVAAFNVFNYFTTMSEDDSQARGAKNAEFFEIQRSKIIAAINDLDADVVALMEIENSVHFGDGTADVALADLVEGLNDAGSNVWDYVDTPDALLETETDVITNAIIYKTDAVTPVGDAMAKIDETVWDNAREPIAQAFDMDGKVVSVVANHFKSKSGQGAEPADGQGHFNDDRTEQAQSLLEFTADIEAATGSADVLLLGDFNAYAQEDPINVFTEAGWTDLVPTANAGYTYTFDGELGSLDHAIVSPSLADSVTGTGVWTINSPEWSDRGYAFGAAEAGTPFRSSDHDPVIVGISTEIPPVDIDIVTINDFHGRIEADGAAAGAAVLSGAVQSVRDANPNTVFAAAGDLIGASTFTSFIDSDNPTIDAFNAAGLEVSAAGNHEFDQGWDDLRDRVQDRADWEYIASNVFLTDTGETALAPAWIKEMEGVRVGFIGAVTEELESLVSPEGIADLDVRNIVDSVNAVAADLTDGDDANGEADVLILLVHEGAASAELSSITPDSPLGEIVDGVDDSVSAIVSAHTHLAYNHVIDGRPVVSAGQYGENFGLMNLQVDPETKELLSITNEIKPLTTTQKDPETGRDVVVPLYEADADVQVIVDEAKANADVLGAESVGEITGDFNRARQSDGSENRGGESTIGNFVADVHQWATGADLALMNPGGIRANLAYASNGDSDPDGNVTFREAATVQPFANTLVTLNLTGAQLKSVLEEQWQPEGASRPFLKLGVSKGLQYTYDPNAATGERITSITLDGAAIDPAATYVVAANSFLAGGGDNFFTLAQGTDKADTGKSDLAAMVDWFDENGTAVPDLGQRAVGAVLSAAGADGYQAGDEVTIELSSLAFSGGEQAPQEVTVSLGETVLVTGAIDSTIVDTTDEAGRASLTFTVPEGVYGEKSLTIAVDGSVTVAAVPITLTDAPAAPGVITLSQEKVAAGSTITIDGEGFEAGIELVAELRSTPVEIGTVTVADDGTFSLEVTIPKNTTAGSHWIVMVQPDGAEAMASLTVTAAEGSGTDGSGSGSGSSDANSKGDLAITGADPTPYVIMAAILLLLGGAFVAVRRRARAE